MLLEKAIFTSTRSQRVSGYHLVSKSGGISEDIAQSLCRWSPSHDSLLNSNQNASSINFFALEEQRFAVSRTVLGGPEYSGRGGLQTVTFLVLVQADQLRQYGNDAIALTQIALRQGDMCFVEGAFNDAKIELPDQHHTVENIPNKLQYYPVLDEVIELVAGGNQVALVGVKQPLVAMQSIVHRLPLEHRVALSFTTGLKPSSQRPFAVHIAQKADIDTRAHFSRKGIRIVNVESAQVQI